MKRKPTINKYKRELCSDGGPMINGDCPFNRDGTIEYEDSYSDLNQKRLLRSINMDVFKPIPEELYYAPTSSPPTRTDLPFMQLCIPEDHHHEECCAIGSEVLPDGTCYCTWVNGPHQNSGACFTRPKNQVMFKNYYFITGNINIGGVPTNDVGCNWFAPSQEQINNKSWGDCHTDILADSAASNQKRYWLPCTVSEPGGQTTYTGDGVWDGSYGYIELYEDFNTYMDVWNLTGENECWNTCADGYMSPTTGLPGFPSYDPGMPCNEYLNMEWPNGFGICTDEHGYTESDLGGGAAYNGVGYCNQIVRYQYPNKCTYGFFKDTGECNLLILLFQGILIGFQNTGTMSMNGTPVTGATFGFRDNSGMPYMPDIDYWNLTWGTDFPDDARYPNQGEYPDDLLLWKADTGTFHRLTDESYNHFFNTGEWNHYIGAQSGYTTQGNPPVIQSNFSIGTYFFDLDFNPIPTDWEYELGDINQSGEIEVVDLVYLINVVIAINEEGYVPTDDELQLGDIYQDGQLNVIDIVGLVNIILYGTITPQRGATINNLTKDEQVMFDNAISKLINSNIPTKSEKQQLQRQLIYKLQRGGSTIKTLSLLNEQKHYYVKYNTRLDDSQLNQKKSEHGLISIKHATKRTDIIPSAANVVIVEGGNIDNIKQDSNVVLVEEIIIGDFEQINDTLFNCDTIPNSLISIVGTCQTSEQNAYPPNQPGELLYTQFEEAIAEFGEGNYHPLIGQFEYAWVDGISQTHDDVTKVTTHQSHILTENESFQDSLAAAHGLMVSSIMVADTNNGYGMAGTCPNCELYFVNAWGDNNNLINYPEMLEIAVEQGLKVINISLGKYSYSSIEEQAFEDAYEQGLVAVASAGNDENDNDTTPHYPSGYNTVIGVGGDYMWHMTPGNFSPTLGTNYGTETIDVSAPGDDVLTAVISGHGNGITSYFNSNGDVVSAECGMLFNNDTDCDDYYPGYNPARGTSLAAPMVVGLMGLLLSHNRFLTNQDLVDIITSTNNIPSSINVGTIPGVINFHEALTYMYENYGGGLGDEDTEPEPGIIYKAGDFNLDGIVNVVDITMLVDIVIDIFEYGYTPTDEELQLFDIYTDGSLNVVDVIEVINIVLDLSTTNRNDRKELQRQLDRLNGRTKQIR